MQEQWLKAQQQYWRAWQTALGGQEFGGGSTDWAKHMGGWWQTLAEGKTAPQGPADVYRLFEQGKNYLVFAESFRRFADAALGKSKGGGGINDALSSMLGEMRKAMSFSTADAVPGVSEFLSFFSWPVESWRSVLGDAGNLASAGPPFDLNIFADPLKLMSGAPSVGLSREWDARLKRLQQSLAAQNEAYAKLLAEHGRIARLAVERFAGQFTGKKSKQGEIATLRELYDLWVDCGEAAYREIVMSDQYAKAYGKFTNAVMNTRVQGQELRDEMLAAVNIPNRPELNTIIERQNELQKTLDTLAEKVNSMIGAGLREHVEILTDEVNELRDQVSALSSKLSPQSQAAATGTKAKPRDKKTAARAPRAKKPPQAHEFDIAEIKAGKD